MARDLERYRNGKGIAFELSTLASHEPKRERFRQRASGLASLE
jgi:hypothetical protein